ncbi:hypothetical protein Tco_1561001 [Tanacetum coccineum]
MDHHGVFHLSDADELPEDEPYEEVAKQGQAPHCSMLMSDPIELVREHVPVTFRKRRAPSATNVPSGDTDKDSIDYPDEPEDGKEDDDEEDDDEDPEEDPSEEHEPEDDNKDPEEDPSEEHEPEDDDTKEEEPSEGSDETGPFEEDETAVTPPPPRQRGARISEDMPPQRTFVLTAPPPRCDVAESSAAAARAPRGQYDFVDTIEAGQGLIRSPGHDARTIARAADRAEDVVYLLDTRTDRRDIRLKIDVVRGQRTAYEIELHEVRQAYLSSEARNRALLA